MVTTLDLKRWAETTGSRAELSRLIRRLAHESGASITAISMPAGESTNLPDWDGVILCSEASAWVPAGRSLWEFSNEAQPGGKANRDYKKRMQQTTEQQRRQATFIFATARSWPGKKKWLAEKCRLAEWGDVRAYDADDLEEWLEQCPHTALWFAETLGLHGFGVETPNNFWERWRRQSNPAITAQAVFHAREAVRDRLLEALTNTKPDRLTIWADSADEAVAFVCAALVDQTEVAPGALVVTAPSGWNFVEQNARVSCAVALQPNFITSAPTRERLTVIAPYAAGDMGRARNTNDLVLDRPDVYEFRDALKGMGMEEADAGRLARSTGRSWSVFCRHRAISAALQHPAWLSLPETAALSSICLLGGWHAGKEADRELVERLAGKPYENVERALRVLAAVDDPPVVNVGLVWKAKAPVELIDLFGDRITAAELTRFFEIAHEILTAADPVLDLPEEERYAAAVYGKVRPQSGLLIESVTDTLIKLAVRGPVNPGLNSAHIDARVEAFVSSVLRDADGIRWLSLSSVLRDLAEAAPRAFLDAVQASLAKPDRPVTRLIDETSSPSALGRCWHADLLWALETLAWAPQNLLRVCLILAELTKVPVKGNWANTPMSVLVGLFRSWIPQTAAPLAQRLEVLDQLIRREADVAFELLDALVHTGPSTAMPFSHPRWRDDDAGAGGVVSEVEMMDMLCEAADRMLEMAEGNAERIAAVVAKVSAFDKGRSDRTASIIDRLVSTADDSQKNIVRVALRQHLHWQRNHGDASEDSLALFDRLYFALSPRDLVMRHSWLFTGGMPDLPIAVPRDDYRQEDGHLERLRRVAVEEILEAEGLLGVARLAEQVGRPDILGHYLVSRRSLGELLEWLSSQGDRLLAEGDAIRQLAGSVAWCLAEDDEHALLSGLVAKGRIAGWDDQAAARIFAIGRDNAAKWDLVAAQGEDVDRAYWAISGGGLWRLGPDTPEFDYALQRLLAAGRARTVLRSVRLGRKGVKPDLLLELLERVAAGEEPSGPLEHWDMLEALKTLEDDKPSDIERLIRLEFGLFKALSFGNTGVAVSLFEAITTRPQLFSDLVCMVFRGKKEPEREAQEHEIQAAHTAYDILHSCRRVPGTQADGTIDGEGLRAFVEEARRIYGDADRLEIGDQQLGAILAHAPSDTDGTWPCRAVADVLDHSDLEEMRFGFRVGTFNKRGVHSRGMRDGGAQERALAEMYQGHARRYQNSHPHLAAVLDELAEGYERDAKREDDCAQLRRDEY